MAKKLTRAQRREANDLVRFIDTQLGGQLRSLPWHAIFAAQFRAGTASPEIVKLAEASRRQWEEIRDRVPTFVAAPAEPAPAPPRPLAQ